MLRSVFRSKSYLGLVLCLTLAVLDSGCVTFSKVFGIDLKNPDTSNLTSDSTDLTGSQFYRDIWSKGYSSRDAAIVASVSDGNIPSHIENLMPVKVSMKLRSGKQVNAVYYVTSDYLAVGNDQNFVHVPMTPMAAQKIADKFGFLLPTRKMVNDIYKQARYKLAPKPLPPSNKMTTVSYFDRHSKLINAQFRSISVGNGIIAGHKKDIVVTNKLARRPYQVAIYGWHRTNGRAIQPLSLVHVNTYADYSHGVRLVRAFMYLNGEKVRVADVLSHREMWKLLSDEGVIRNARVKTTTTHRWLARLRSPLSN